jgi:uncharacterized protein (TIGR03435 family)
MAFSRVTAQSAAGSTGAHFDSISITASKTTTGGGMRTLPDGSGGMRTLPDGTFVMTNSAIRSILLAGSPTPVREVKGAPDWVNTDRYDITATPPTGSSREQNGERMRNLLIDRLKLAGHVEEQDQTTFALVVGTPDGSLGPQMRVRTAECPPPPTAPTRPTFPEGCGSRMGPGMIEAGGIQMATFVRSISGLVGAQVIDKTGLKGRYDLTLHFAPTQPSPTNPSANDAPPFVQAVREQLGLTLYPETTKMSLFVIDHLERPTLDEP